MANQTAVISGIGAAVLTVVIGASIYGRAPAPNSIFEGRMASVADDAGYFSIVGILSPAVLLDGGAGAAPDALLSVQDSGPAAFPDASSAPLGGVLDPADKAPGPSASPSGTVVLATNQGALIPPQNSAPVVGVAVSDPAFPGVTVRRILPAGMHDYSQLQPWSPDEALILLFDGAAYRTYSWPGMAAKLTPPAELNALRWLRPPAFTGHKMLGVAGLPYRFVIWDADTGAQAVAYSSPYPTGATSEPFEEVSNAGWTVGIGKASSGSRTIFAVNLASGTLGAQLGLDTGSAGTPLFAPAGPCAPGAAVDWIRVSPASASLMIQWDRSGSALCSGLELRDLKTGAFIRHVHDHGNHSDVGITGGREYVMTSLTSPCVADVRPDGSCPAPLWQNNNLPAAVMEWLDGSPTTFLRLISWAAFEHVSCLMSASGCVVTGSSAVQAGLYSGEVWFLGFDGTARQLAYHRSVQFPDPSGCQYWVEPRAAVSPSGRMFVADSNWGKMTCGAQAPYVVSW